MKFLYGMFLAGACLAAAASQPHWVSLNDAHHGTLEVDLAILNPCGDVPVPVLDFFRAARQALEGGGKTAGFADSPALGEVCQQFGKTHLGGPMLGVLAPDGVRVWVRTVRPAAVTVVVTTAGGEKKFGPVRSTAATDLTAVVPITGLQPDTRYPYRVLVDDQPLAIPPDAALHTAPAPDAQGLFQLAFGADYHKIGLHNRALHEQIRQRGNRAMLLYGDLAADDRRNNLNLLRSDYLLRDLSPAWQGLVTSVPVYATWDDHDYFDNDVSGIPKGFTDADRLAVRQVWTQNWNNPAHGLEKEERGIFFRTRLGPADVIMLDTRFFREKGRFLGADQMNWLKQQLLACRGPFIILTGGTMWTDYVSDGKDSWGVVEPAAREELFRFIEQHHIGGVLLLSGDRHGARGMKIPRPSGFTFYEFEIGSLGKVGGPPALGSRPEQQFFGFTGGATFAFGEFAFDTTKPDPEVTFRLIDDTGAELHRLTLQRSQLTPPEAGKP